MPARGARPVKRLVALAEALSGDGLESGALSEVEREMRTILDTYATRYARKLDDAEFEVHAVRGQSIAGTVGKSKLTYIDARKAFGTDIAQSYVNHLAPDDEADDDGLRSAYVKTSALATVPEVREKVDTEAGRTRRQVVRPASGVDQEPDRRAAAGLRDDPRTCSAAPEAGGLRDH